MTTKHEDKAPKPSKEDKAAEKRVTPDKPVGTVWLAWCINGLVTAELHHFDGNRQQIREATTVCALKGLIARLSV